MGGRIMTRSVKALATAVGLAAASLMVASPAAAHCDSMDGPVVKAAEVALAAGEVERVLLWVRPQDEPEIRDAFARTLEVRALGGTAQEMADRWFFETLVRVHREGEGAPYTGLKPAGYEIPAGIAMADRALEDGSVDAVATRISAHLERAIRERFEEASALRSHDPTDVEAGRRYVHAYVEYIHLVEEVVALLHGGAHAH
jgi:hypothetical protein